MNLSKTLLPFTFSGGIKKTLLALFAVIILNPNTHAQGFDALLNPKVSVKLMHPPGLGLKINKVVFNPVSGYYSDKFIDEIINDFIRNGIDVLDRRNLESILVTHNIYISDYIDRNTAISIGKIIGPSAMVTMKVLRYHTEHKDNLYVDEKKRDSKTKKDYIERVYIART